MSHLQRVVFLAGAALAISLASTIVVLVLGILLPGHPIVTLAGPILCGGSALIFSKYYYGRL